MHTWTKSLLVALVCLTSLAPSAAQPYSQDGLTYKSGYSTMMKLGSDLYRFLPREQSANLSPQPISIETDVTPFIRLLYYPDAPRPIRGVWISAGFIDLVNQVAHAKAIDKIERGYFKKYIAILATETGASSLRPLPNDHDPRFWTDDMLNEQLSNFNSIVGTVVGIKLAHHYLGHYDKYEARLTDASGQPVPINRVLTPKEWDEAFTHGVANALNAGCLIEGVLPFFEAFDKAPVRQPWMDYFLPEGVNFTKIRREMQNQQRKFLTGG